MHSFLKSRGISKIQIDGRFFLSRGEDSVELGTIPTTTAILLGMELFDVCKEIVEHFFDEHGIKIFLEKDRLFLFYKGVYVDFDSEKGSILIDLMAAKFDMERHLVAESIVAMDYSESWNPL